jgi:hypothetical protein
MARATPGPSGCSRSVADPGRGEPGEPRTRPQAGAARPQPDGHTLNTKPTASSPWGAGLRHSAVMSVSSACQAEDGKRPGGVAAGMSQRGGEVEVAGKAQRADGEVAEAGHHPGEAAAARGGGVFAEGHVADPVQPVLDPPVPTQPVGQLGGAGAAQGRLVTAYTVTVRQRRLPGAPTGDRTASSTTATSPGRPTRSAGSSARRRPSSRAAGPIRAGGDNGSTTGRMNGGLSGPLTPIAALQRSK